jgi:hypothetical protein
MLKHFFQEGIQASMESAGVAVADIAAYLATNGALTGTDAKKLEQIINENSSLVMVLR